MEYDWSSADFTVLLILITAGLGALFIWAFWHLERWRERYVLARRLAVRNILRRH